MRKKLLLGLFFLAGILSSFFFGTYVGSAPVREYMELTGGPAGIAATDLENLSNRLIDKTGKARDANSIEGRSMEELRVHILLAAQLYCRMPDQYQRVAKQAAIKLKSRMADMDERTTQALTYLMKGEGLGGDKCSST